MSAPAQPPQHPIPAPRVAVDPALARALNTPTVMLPGRYEYSGYSVLAGPAEVPGPGPNRVRMRPLARRRPLTTVLITLFAFTFEATFFAWLLSSMEVPDPGLHTWLYVATVVMIAATGLIELFRLVNVVTLCLATLWARDPVPMVPDHALRVAFLTTIVPGKEPVAMVERTLRAARAIRHPGRYDVWLLDEGDDDEVKAMCARVGVRHFSRRGRAEFNTEAGAYKAKTKHGNYDNVVTRWAESQQYLFHSLLQRAGNRLGVSMLVGTNNAVRISALRSIGGLQDSITEDMATSLVLHSARNPHSGKRWRSVYTPDVLAVGEGPSSWTDYFTQQHRWSRGTDEVVVTSFAKFVWRLGFRRALHYGLLMSYYPLTALAWLLGAVNAVCYLVLGAKGVQVPQQVWLMLYVDAALFQLGLYVWNRRHNTSPHEEAGSSGLTGMLMSTLSTPVYVSSYLSALLRRRSGFVVTPKGDSASPDRLLTFGPGLRWAAFYVVLLICAPIGGHVDGAMWLWPGLNLVICLLPPAIWAGQEYQRRRAAPRPDGTPQDKSVAEPVESLV